MRLSTRKLIGPGRAEKWILHALRHCRATDQPGKSDSQHQPFDAPNHERMSVDLGDHGWPFDADDSLLVAEGGADSVTCPAA